MGKKMSELAYLSCSPIIDNILTKINNGIKRNDLLKKIFGDNSPRFSMFDSRKIFKEIEGKNIEPSKNQDIAIGQKDAIGNPLIQTQDVWNVTK